MGWKDSIQPEKETSIDNKSSWRASARDEKKEEEFKKLMAETQGDQVDLQVIGDVAKKFAQGASMGFLPRIAGGLEAGGQALGVKGLGGKDITDIELQVPNLNLAENYEMAKKAYEAELDAAAKRSPTASAIAEIAGGVASFSPATKGASVTKALGTMAGMGALQGLGYSRGDLTDIETLKNIGTGAGLGALAGGAGMGLSKGLSKIGGQFDEWGRSLSAPLKENADEITRASKELGFDPTKGMLTTSKEVQAIEEGLAKNATLPSSRVRKQVQTMYDSLKSKLDDLEKFKSGSSAIEEGEASINTMQRLLAEKQKPVTELYEKVNSGLQTLPVNQDVLNTSFEKLSQKDLFKNDQGRAFLEGIKKEVGELSNLSSLNNYIQDIYKKRSPMMTGREASFLDNVYSGLKDIRNESISTLKKVPQIQNLGAQGSQMLDDLLNNLKQAESLHSKNVQEIASVGNLFGTRGKELSPKMMNEAMDTLGLEQAGKLARGSSYESLLATKEKFPELFDRVRQSKLNEFLEKATTKGELDFNKVSNQYSKLPKELKEILFDVDTKSMLDNFETVYNSIPKVTNPSGTSQMMRISEMLNPVQNLMDLGSDLVLKTSGKNQSSILNTVGKGIEGLSKMPNVPRKALGPLMYDTTSPENNEQKKKEVNKQDGASIFEKVRGSKYEQVLQNAKNKGDNSFNAAYYVLANQDKDFRKLLES